LCRRENRPRSRRRGTGAWSLSSQCEELLGTAPGPRSLQCFPFLGLSDHSVVGSSPPKSLLGSLLCRQCLGNVVEMRLRPSPTQSGSRRGRNKWGTTRGRTTSRSGVDKDGTRQQRATAQAKTRAKRRMTKEREGHFQNKTPLTGRGRTRDRSWENGGGR